MRLDSVVVQRRAPPPISQKTPRRKIETLLSTNEHEACSSSSSSPLLSAAAQLPKWESKFIPQKIDFLPRRYAIGIIIAAAAARRAGLGLRWQQSACYEDIFFGGEAEKRRLVRSPSAAAERRAGNK